MDQAGAHKGTYVRTDGNAEGCSSIQPCQDLRVKVGVDPGVDS